MTISYIYKITNTINNKSYIGFTTDVAKRLRRYNKPDIRDNRLIAKAIRKYTWNAFTFEILYCSLERDHTLSVMESHFISFYQTHFITGNGYNMTCGGEGTFGYVVSESTKKKIKQATSGKNNPFYGHTHTKETKTLLGDLKRGKPLPPRSHEFKNKMRSLKLGGKRKFTPEWKAKWYKEYLVVDPLGNEYLINGLRPWCKNHNIDRRSLMKSLTNKSPLPSGKYKGWQLKPISHVADFLENQPM